MHINGRNPFDRRIGGLFRLTNLELRLLSRAHRATDSIHGREPVGLTPSINVSPTGAIDHSDSIAPMGLDARVDHLTTGSRPWILSNTRPASADYSTSSCKLAHASR